VGAVCKSWCRTGGSSVQEQGQEQEQKQEQDQGPEQECIKNKGMIMSGGPRNARSSKKGRVKGQEKEQE